MNAFAENPFLFFVDKVPSIFTVDIPRNTRKIIELSDTGCDARVPVAALPPNSNRYYSPKSPRMKSNEAWRSYYEGKLGYRSHKEKSRGQTGRNAMNPEELYFITKEDENVHQRHWQKHSLYNNVNDDAVFSTDFEVNSRASPGRINVLPWDYNPYETQASYYDHDTASPNFQNQTSIPREDRPHKPHKGAKANGVRPSSGRSNYPKVDPRIYDQKILADRERTETLILDYPDSFESEEPPRNSPAKDHWQRLKTSPYEDNENPIDPRKNYGSSRGTSRNMRNTNSPKGNGSSRYCEETQNSRIRSRTCSPPANRQKRTRSVMKSYQENVDQAEDRYNTQNQYNTQNSRDSEELSRSRNSGNTESARNEGPTLIRSTEKLKKFMDRAVDKDSLSDVLNVSTSTNYLPHSMTQMSAADEEQGKGGFGFWEFIPLDENDQKCVKTPGKIAPQLQQKMYSGGKSYLQTRDLADDREGVNPRTKRKTTEKGAAEQDSTRPASGSSNMRSSDDSSPSLRPTSARGTMKSERNLSSNSPPLEQSTKSLLDSHEARVGSAGSRIPRYSDSPEKLRTQDQSKQSKNQSKVDSRFGFSFRKSSQYLKRPNSGKSETNADKKKKTVEKAGMSFVEKTAACLKRKLERKAEEASPSRRSATMTEKKVRSEGSTYSRLPIRIGSRLRSKDPASLRTPDNKSQPPKVQTKINGSSEESSSQQSSVRSRTKPKVKQTVEQTRVILDPVAVTVNPLSMENVQVTSVKNSYQGSEKGDSKLVNTAENRSIDHTSRERDSLKTRLLKNEKLGARVEDLKILNVEQDQQKRDLLSRSCGKEASRRSNLLKEVNAGGRNDFKEKCFFHLDDENMICNNYCSKDHKNVHSFRSGRSVPIRSRF